MSNKEKLDIEFKATMSIDDVTKKIEELEKKVDVGFGKMEESSKKTTKAVDMISNAINYIKTAGIIGTIMFFGSKVIEASTALFDLAKGAVETKIALLGLYASAKKQGSTFDETKTAAQKLASDGLMSVQQAATGLKFLLQSGFNIEEAMNLAQSMKNIGAFGNTVGDLGQAFVDASKGIKTGSVELTENIGLTERLSSVMEKAGVDIKNGIDVTNNVNQRMALYNSILKQGEENQGNAAKLAKEMTGQYSSLKATIKETADIIGNRLIPIFSNLIEFSTSISKFIKKIFSKDIIEEANDYAKAVEKQKYEFEILHQTYKKLNSVQNKSKEELRLYKETIAKMKEAYPQYLKNIDLEKEKYENVAGALAEVNKHLRLKELYARKEQELSKQTKKITDADINQYDELAKAYNLQAQAQAKYDEQKKTGKIKKVEGEYYTDSEGALQYRKLSTPTYRMSYDNERVMAEAEKDISYFQKQIPNIINKYDKIRSDANNEIQKIDKKYNSIAGITKESLEVSEKGKESGAKTSDKQEKIENKKNSSQENNNEIIFSEDPTARFKYTKYTEYAKQQAEKEFNSLERWFSDTTDNLEQERKLNMQNATSDYERDVAQLKYNVELAKIEKEKEIKLALLGTGDDETKEILNAELDKYKKDQDYLLQQKLTEFEQQEKARIEKENEIKEKLKSKNWEDQEYSDPYASRFGNGYDEYNAKLEETLNADKVYTDSQEDLARRQSAADELKAQAREFATDTLKRAVMGEKLNGKELRKALMDQTASTLASLAAESGVKALFETAQGLADTAMGNPGAAVHFASAKMYATTALAAGAAARTVSAMGSNGKVNKEDDKDTKEDAYNNKEGEKKKIYVKGDMATLVRESVLPELQAAGRDNYDIIIES